MLNSKQQLPQQHQLCLMVPNANSVKIEQQHCEGQNSPQLVRSVTSNTATSGDYNNYDHLLDNISIINISPSRNDGNIPPPGTTAGTSAHYSLYLPLFLLRLHYITFRKEMYREKEFLLIASFKPKKRQITSYQ